jgi:glycosyltransferase involved in cell wall biosynthesis
MNVLHISESDAGGGAGKSARNLHEALRATGVSSRMLVGRKLTDDGEVRSIKRNVAWRAADRAAGTVADRTGLQYAFYPSSFGVLRDPWFRECDVLQLHNLHGSFFGFSALPALARRRPIVWWMQDMWPVTGHVAYSFECDRWLHGCGSCPHLREYPPLPRDTTALLWRLKRRAYRGMRPALVVSSRWLAGVASRSPLVSHFDLRVIPNGVDLEVFSPRVSADARRELGLDPEERTVLVFDGEARKGALLIAGILGALAAGGTNATVLVAGERGGWELPAGLAERPLGRITDDRTLSNAYAAADVFLFPTLADNLPNAILEALACGTPVVASDVGGVPDAVLDGRNGLLAPVGDVVAFAEAIRSVLEDPERRLSYAAEARRSAEAHYDNAEQTRRFLELYEELAA